ncbi:MAG: SDR family oxidoreductase [Deltaproteobacteria bacterium]|nr:SDR family oxidoreductase [Deltaproteobacteria bacterium]
MTLNNRKLALLTGAAGVVGSETARGLAAEGYRVVMVDLDGNQLEALAQDIGRGSYPLALDVADPQKVAEACATIRQELGQVSVLVNNAGVLSNHKAAETTDDEWRHILAVNLDGAFYLSREWLPGMKTERWGRIINVCSLAMKTGGITAGTAYTASKGALASLTFSLAREAASYGVTVNGIAPAYIKTPMVMDQLTEDQRRQLLDQIPVGRFCEAEEVAHVVRFLVSPLSGFITGEIIDINGGLHMD